MIPAVEPMFMEAAGLKEDQLGEEKQENGYNNELLLRCIYWE